MLGRIPMQYSAGVIYRFYDADRTLIYLGMTGGDPTSRWTRHRYRSSWWHLAAFVSVAHVTPNRTKRAELEREAIRAERPLHNKSHNEARARMDVRLDEGSASVVEQFRRTLLPADFAAVAKAFAAELDNTN
jgi:hypothetical protein